MIFILIGVLLNGKKVPRPKCPGDVTFEFIDELLVSQDLESLNELQLHIEGALSEVALVQ
jgi:hypothetical protein